LEFFNTIGWEADIGDPLSNTMVADAICDVTKQGELVLDIFLGSGTSLIAAERVGRVFRGLDIDPAYVDLAMTRWSELSEEKIGALDLAQV